VLAAGKPAIWIGPRASECGQILREVECGYELAPGDAAGLVRVVREIIADRASAECMGQRGRAAYEARYSLVRCCEQWRQLLSEVARGTA
jgi:glycosyltransferase involved in cell wall biosynthesis